MTVVRYVERNPLRAALVARPEDWPWSSLGALRKGLGARPALALEELRRRGDWAEIVSRPMTEAEVESIRLAIRRGRPFGSDAWTVQSADQLGLESSLRSRGGQRRAKLDPGASRTHRAKRTSPSTFENTP